MRTVYFASKDGAIRGIQASAICAYAESGHTVFKREYPDMGKIGEPGEAVLIDNPTEEQERAVAERVSIGSVASCSAAL